MEYAVAQESTQALSYTIFCLYSQYLEKQLVKTLEFEMFCDDSYLIIL